MNGQRDYRAVITIITANVCQVHIEVQGLRLHIHLSYIILIEPR